MPCKSCGGNRFMSVNGKTSDMVDIVYLNHISGEEIQSDGYVPYDIGIGGGDYLRFTLCVACGTIFEFKPLLDDEIREALKR